MQAQNKETAELALGKGVYDERSPRDPRWQETMETDPIDMNMHHWNNDYSNKEVQLQEEYVDTINKEKNKADQVKIKADEDDKFDEELDEYEYQQSINQYGRYVPPIPKYLIVKNTGRRRFSDENVMRRTAWLGKLLNIRDRNKLPEMRKIEITREDNKDEKEQVISIVAETQEQSRILLETENIGPCRVKVKSETKGKIR